MVLVFGYLLFLLVGVSIFIYTKDVEEDFYEEDCFYNVDFGENLIGDAYVYKFVESDYERVEKELIRFADELALGY